MEPPLRLGIPTNARLLPKSREIFSRAGFPLPYFERCAVTTMDCMPGAQVCYMRSRDLPRMVESGHVDFAVTTHSMIVEADAHVTELLPLNFSRYRVVLAGGVHIARDDLSGAVIATPLPRLARAYCASRRISGVTILDVRGAVEAYAIIGVARAIVDISETGTSLRKNGLRVLDVILEASAVLICGSHLSSAKRSRIQTMVDHLEAALPARPEEPDRNFSPAHPAGSLPA